MASPAEALFAPLREAAERAGIGEFLRWWAGELFAAIPAVWRERLSPGGTAFVLADADEWRAVRPASGRLVEAGRVRLATLDPAGRRAGFRRLVEEASGGATNVWLVLPDEAVLVRGVFFPLAAEEALRDAVGFDLDRLTPYAQEQACFDHRVTGRDAVNQRLSIELAVAPRAPVEARLAELRELGATVLGVGIAGDVAASPAPFNLLAPEARERPSASRTATAARLLAALAALLGLAALGYPLLQKREAVIELMPRLEKAKAGADVADRLAKEIEKLASEHNFLVARKQGQHPATVLLEDLSRLLPDTTWVQQLDIKTGPKIRELQIAGETGSSSQLIEVLEKSGSLVNASFKSPLTKGVTPGTERFLVSAEVKPRALPEPIAEGELVKVAKPAEAGMAPGTTAPAAPPAAAPAPPAAAPAPAPAKVPDTPAPAKPAPKG